MSAQETNDIVFYHYRASPYAKKIANYLALRGIHYAACNQPVILPRNDLKILGINYRRIPLLAIGRDVYADSRLIIRKLDQHFPKPANAGSAASHGVERLLERWISDSGVFWRAAGLIPADMPTMKDPAFLKDRSDLSGRTWSSAGQAKGRPESLVYVEDAFDLLESTFLADSKWIGGGQEPTLADVEAAFVFEWLTGLPGALPSSFEAKYPKVFDWIKRLTAVVKSKYKKPAPLNGQQARDRVLAAKAKDRQGVDPDDPTGLKQGDIVELFPVDTGFNHRDVGRLVTLNKHEVAIEVETKTPGKSVILHAPRWGFRVAKPRPTTPKL